VDKQDAFFGKALIEVSGEPQFKENGSTPGGGLPISTRCIKIFLTSSGFVMIAITFYFELNIKSFMCSK